MSDDLQSMLRSTKYPPAAFAFVQQGLDYTVRRAHGEPKTEPRGPLAGATAEEDGDAEPRHVSGEQLCWGLRDYAIEQYGLLAPLVLRHWHIRSCEDFGEIVFAMIHAGLMRKTEEDSLRDFEEVFDFAEAFPRRLELD